MNKKYNKNFKIKKPRYSNRLIIGEMTLSGILYAMFILFRFIFKDINLINGYSPQIQFIILALGLFYLNTYLFRFIFILVSPLMLIIFGISGHILFDYILPCWSFFIFMWIYPISNKFWNISNRTKYKSVIIFASIIAMNVLSYLLVLFSYTTSGVVMYYVPVNESFLFNLPIIAISFAISTGVMLLVIYPLYLSKVKINHKIFY